MEGKRRGRLSETLFVGVLLAVSGGFLDAYTYLYRGKVFANGQTGNLVLLGIRAADKDWSGVSYYALPILAFVFGVLAADLIRIGVSDAGMIKWRHVILGMEIVILTVVLFTPHGDADRLVNIAISFVCALQTQSFRSLRGKPYISVMCTGNLRSAAAELTLFGQERDFRNLRNAWDYILIVLCFIGGALAGAILTDMVGGLGLILVIALLAVVLTVLFMRRPIIAFCEKHRLNWLEWE